MAGDARPKAAEPRRRHALAGYLAFWLAGAAAVVALLVVVLDGRDEEPVALPPVQHIELTDAAQAAGCEFRRVRRGEPTNPPVEGAAGGSPASPGVKSTAPAVPSLVAALRHGILVIHYRPGLDDERIDELKEMQGGVPEGTIVTPNPTAMPYEVAATAYRRLLVCRRYTDATLDALRLFRGRFVGSGPDK
jgi:Protein of unknown function (DUF3105)